RSAGATALPADRVHLNRTTRPRWLQGAVTDSERWDAFEAIRGAPLVEQPELDWEHGRVVLQDLAQELDAALETDTLPPLVLDQVWMDEDRHAKILDAPLEQTEKPGPRLATAAESPEVAAVGVLRAAARFCARGTDLPIHAQGFVTELDQRPNDRATISW